MKATDRIGKGARVLGDRGRDPGMRQLKQQCAPGSQKDYGFPVDPPRHRRRSENALSRPGGAGPDNIESSV
ncbi:hypothetical protein [Bradyrhizobium australiense]|uniref:hypothetical protein n=1 Tax=Bradyrhizobium australiense TaxID=2721161 RepID=UPI001F388EB1|nr:hypothetical protein [Bradyrhizobium australiense]